MNHTKLLFLFALGSLLVYPYHVSAEGQYVCAIVSEMLPSDSEGEGDSAFFRLSGNFVLKGNKKKVVRYHLFGADEGKTKREIALLESSYKKKQKIYILAEGDMIKGVKDKCR
ncbi:hypothetical protein CCP3SC1AL1_2080005 [Gammaproteobacteria bacterium]